MCRSHTHTHSHSLTDAHSHSLTLTHSHSHSHSLALHSHSHSLSHSLTTTATVTTIPTFITTITSLDPRKRATARSSGRTGRWRGHPECVNVINGRDQPHNKWPVAESAKFCGECGCAVTSDHHMTAGAKRSGDSEWLLKNHHLFLLQ